MVRRSVRPGQDNHRQEPPADVFVLRGTGWSKGVLHTLEGSRVAIYCHPPTDLQRKRNRPATRELDHVLVAVFGLWHFVIPDRISTQLRACHQPNVAIWYAIDVPGCPSGRIDLSSLRKEIARGIRF